MLLRLSAFTRAISYLLENVGRANMVDLVISSAKSTTGYVQPYYYLAQVPVPDVRFDLGAQCSVSVRASHR